MAAAGRDGVIRIAVGDSNTNATSAGGPDISGRLQGDDLLANTRLGKVQRSCLYQLSSGDGVDRGRQPRLERVGNWDISVVRQAILACADRALQERLHRQTDLGIGILRADNLVGRQHYRIGAGLVGPVERDRVEGEVVALLDEPGKIGRAHV